MYEKNISTEDNMDEKNTSTEDNMDETPSKPKMRRRSSCPAT